MIKFVLALGLVAVVWWFLSGLKDEDDTREFFDSDESFERYKEQERKVRH